MILFIPFYTSSFSLNSPEEEFMQRQPVIVKRKSNSLTTLQLEEKILNRIANVEEKILCRIDCLYL